MRPPHQPPLSCVIRSKFKLDSGDGSAACAVCYALGKFQCGSRVNRRNSIEAKALATMTPSLYAGSSTTQPESVVPDLFETMASNDDIQGDLSAPESNLKRSRSLGKSHAYLSTGSEDLDDYSHSLVKEQPLRRTLTDGSRRRARFLNAPGLSGQLEALENLTTQVEALQQHWARQNEKVDKLEESLASHGSILSKIQQKSEEQSVLITKLQANNTDQTSSNFHLARLIEVVDDLQRSIVAQKTDIQALKKGSPVMLPKTDLVPREPFAEENNTIDELRRFIDETEDKQRQRKAVYLEHLNRELQRTMMTTPMSSMNMLPRSFDP